MNPVVNLEMGREDKCLGTFFALVWLLPFVDEHVTLEVPGTRERFVAKLTRVTPARTSMAAFHVFFQTSSRLELLFAVDAF